MIDDILQALIDERTNYSNCHNCIRGYCMQYGHKNKICSGVVKQVDPEISFDVIRLCIATTSEGLQPYDYTPDEAQSIMTVLSHSVGDWTIGQQAYQIFRTGSKNNKLAAQTNAK